MNFFYAILFCAVAANATKIIAILEITPKTDSINMSISEFRHLTDELRTKARESLPKNYTILARDNIMQLLPPDEKERECLAEGCAVDIGRVIGAEYVTQGFVGKFGKMLTLTVELYESMSGNLMGSFVSESEDIMGLLNAMRQKAPGLFATMPESIVSVSEPILQAPKTKPEASVSKPIKTSTWIAVGLDVLGVAAIGFGVWQNNEVAKLHKNYNALTEENANYKEAGKKVDNAANKRNVAYVVGGALLATGIGVHILF